MLPKIAITLGDPTGIGPEILAKLLTYEQLKDKCIPIVIGDTRIVQQGLDLIESKVKFETITNLNRKLSSKINYVYDLNNISPNEYVYGQVNAKAGKAAGEFIETAITLAMHGQIDAVVTNPIHKEAFRLGGYGQKYPGHTEMFADLTGAKTHCMMLASGNLRVCHVTGHVSLIDALTKGIKKDRILEVIKLAHDMCKKIGITQPAIGVAGINPHAGENGLFGSEESREIIPAIKQARSLQINAEGPLPADTLFTLAKGEKFDACVAMYHDQGQIPVKLDGFEYDHSNQQWDVTGINVTLGLPIIRTSVDHGTAFDKAGKGIASHCSLLDALDFAIRLVGSSDTPNIHEC